MNTLTQTIKEAVKFQQEEGHSSLNALDKYLEATAAGKEENDEYERLYAHYQVMWIYSHLNQIEKALSYAEICLAMIGEAIQTGAIFHFTENGNFQEEVIRYATNVVAWHSYENSDNTKELEEALSTISLGCQYANEPLYYYLFDTKARILIKLGRKEEAFIIVYNCLKKAPDFPDFADLKVDEEYRKWKDNFETGNLEYSQKEKELLLKAARITSRIREKLDEREKHNEQSETVIPEKELITTGEADEQYGIPDGFYNEDDCVLVFKGDVHIKGDLDSDWYDDQLKGISWNNELYGIVIDGSLIVDGDITIDLPIFHIIEDLTCDYLYSGDGHTMIEGDANVSYGIYGYYNDGSLEIDGTLTTPYLIASDHCMPRESDKGEFIYIEGGDGNEMDRIDIGESTGSGSGWDWHYYEDSEKLLSKAVCDENYKFSVKRFFDLVKQGENPFNQLK